MPLPFAIPPRRHVFPPKEKETATSFFTVSVVIIAAAASPWFFGDKPSTSCPMCSAIGAIGSDCPITPVEATMTSSGVIRSCCAVSSHICHAFSSPSALHVLAFLLFTMTACAFPPVASRFFFVTIIGAPFTLLVVYTAAVLQSVSLYTMPRSFLFGLASSPQ